MDSCWNRENIMRKICVFASLALMAAMLGVNVYNSIVDARSWSANIPDSILTARNYFKTVNPGTFFRTASPFNQLLALAALVACWKSGRKVRLYFGLAFLLAVLTDALTFAYFYPRNEILFRAAQSNADVFTKICSEWSTMNWVRSMHTRIRTCLFDEGSRRILRKGTTPHQGNGWNVNLMSIAAWTPNQCAAANPAIALEFAIRAFRGPVAQFGR